MEKERSFKDYKDPIHKRIKDGDIDLDIKGHFSDFDKNSFVRNSDYLINNILGFSFTLEIFNRLKEKSQEGKKNEQDDLVEEMIQSDRAIKLGEMDCYVCGEHIAFYLENKRIYADKECPYKNGFPEIEVEIDVPSGQLVLYNDLRKYYPKEESRYVNYLNEIKLESEDYANKGLIHIFVGNTCPGIYKEKEDRLIIGSYYDPDTDEDMRKDIMVGSICTDLWWYGATDRSDFERKSGMTVADFDVAEEKRGYWTRLNIVNVTPGRYKATGRHHLVDDGDRPVVFSVISRIGPVQAP